MTNFDDYFYFGFVLKAVGFNGTIALKVEVDEIENYKKLKTIYIDVNGNLVAYPISKVILRTNNIINLKLLNFDNEESIQNLLKQQVYLPDSMLPKLTGNEFYIHEVIGFELIDVNFGKVGIVKDVLDMPKQKILQIMNGFKEVLIPLNEGVLQTLDRTNKTMTIQAAEGLIALYLGDNQDEDE